MQKKVKYSIGGLVAVSILGLGLVQHNDKVHVENKLKQKEAWSREHNPLFNVDKKENEIFNDDNEIVNDSPQRSEIDRESG